LPIIKNSVASERDKNLVKIDNVLGKQLLSQQFKIMPFVTSHHHLKIIYNLEVSQIGELGNLKQEKFCHIRV